MDRTRIHHIGIVVFDRARMQDFLEIFHFEIDREEYVEAYHAQCVFTKHNDREVALEFVIPDSGPLVGFNQGKGGLHHIALEVDDVEAVRQEYTEKGRLMLEEHAVQGACGILVNFLRPRYGAGILWHHRTIVSAAFAQSFAPSVQL